MLYRTLSEAQDKQPISSWKEKVILKVVLKDGRTFFRSYEFDQTRDKCKRCRKARRTYNARVRLSSTGHICEVCGNPYAGFVRQSVAFRGGKWVVLADCWGSSGQLH